MTELQKCEFEMLKVLNEVCNTLNIKFFLLCGSALGAAKYQGFIPWDDDIDVGLFREDYEKLMKLGPSLLPDHLFLQNHISDPKYPLIFSKLRNSNTTFIEKSISNLDINHGIYIDIFPLDKYPKSKWQQFKLEMKKWYYSHQASVVFNTKRSFKGRVLKRINILFSNHKRTQNIVFRYEKSIAYYKAKRSSIICNHGNWQGKLEYFHESVFGEGEWKLFEGLQIRIPKHYDKYLSQKYGDWRAELPEDKKFGHHFYVVCDVKKPYVNYLEKTTKGVVVIKN